MSTKNPKFRFNGAPKSIRDLAVKDNGRTALVKLNLDKDGRPELSGLYHDTIRAFVDDSNVLEGLMLTAQTGLQNYMRQATKEDIKAGIAEEAGEWIYDLRAVKSNEQMAAVTKSVAVISKMLSDLMKMQGKSPAKSSPNALPADNTMAEIEGKYDAETD